MPVGEARRLRLNHHSSNSWPTNDSYGFNSVDYYTVTLYFVCVARAYRGLDFIMRRPWNCCLWFSDLLRGRHGKRETNVFSRTQLHISPPILYLNILSFILPPVFAQRRFIFYYTTVNAGPMAGLDEVTTYRHSKNTSEHCKYKSIAYRIPTPRPLTQIQIPVDGSVWRDTTVLIIPIRRIRDGW